jgi:protein arginine kinase activator
MQKCDRCDNEAKNHIIEVVKGKKVWKHLCDFHATEDGLIAKSVHTPVSDLLNNLVKVHSGGHPPIADLTCQECGMTFAVFRENGLLGCPMCYTAFETELGPLLERTHECGTHHIGKVPRRSGESQARQVLLLRLRKQLADAVANEDYKAAARLRDEVRGLEVR